MCYPQSVDFVRKVITLRNAAAFIHERHAQATIWATYLREQQRQRLLSMLSFNTPQEFVSSKDIQNFSKAFADVVSNPPSPETFEACHAALKHIQALTGQDQRGAIALHNKIRMFLGAMKSEMEQVAFDLGEKS